MEGWISLHRQILDWQWYSEPNTFRVFIHLLLKANHKPKKFLHYTIEVGQLVTSISHLALELKLSIQNIRTALNNLISTGEINKQSTSKLTIITINNYKDFQEHLTNKPTRNQQTTNKQLTTNNNDNNEIINNKNNTKVVGFDFSFLDKTEYVKYKNIFRKWIQYKLKIKDMYKTQEGLELALKKLVKLSNYNLQTAEAIIEESIVNNWKGLFALKTNGKAKTDYVPEYIETEFYPITDEEKEFMTNKYKEAQDLANKFKVTNDYLEN